MKNNIIQITKIALVVGTLTFGSIALAAWTTPPAAPTTCPAGTDGCNAPINVGATGQGKSGSLRLGGSGAPTTGYVLDTLGLTGTQGLTNTGASKLAGNTSIGAAISAAIPGAMLSVGATELTGSPVSTIFKTNAGSTLGGTMGSKVTLASLGYKSPTNTVSFGVHALRTTGGTSWDTSAIGLMMDVDNVEQAGPGGTPGSGASLWFNPNGFLGINTSSPTQRLHVNGNVRADGFCIGSGACITSWPSGGSAGITGSGTTNHLAKWSGTSLVDSAVVEGGESRFWNGTYVDPDISTTYAIKATSISAGTLRQGNIPVCLQTGTNCPILSTNIYIAIHRPGYTGTNSFCHVLSTSASSAGIIGGQFGDDHAGELTTAEYCGIPSIGAWWSNTVIGHLNQ